MIIGELISLLEKAPSEHRVYFSFCHSIPTTVRSWRGIYAEPALGWKPSGYSGNVETYPTVAMLLEELRHSLTIPHHGWKGGEYDFDESQTLHIDNPGDCTHTEIASVEINKYHVIIHTHYEES